MQHIFANRATLDKVIPIAPLRWQVILEAVRQGSIGVAQISQGKFRFDAPPPSPPTLAIIGDDTDHAEGPTGLHSKSLRRLLGVARQVLIISSGPTIELYQAAVDTAAAGRLTVLIETRLEQEQPWLEFVQRWVAPKTPILVSTVRPAGGVH